jgi:hypothetical protein
MSPYRRRLPVDAAAQLERLTTAMDRYREESDALTRRLGQQILACREAGATWGEIGERLGMTKQGARAHWDSYLQQTFGSPPSTP